MTVHTVDQHDGFEALMASVESEKNNVEQVETVVEQTPTQVETQIDEPVQVSKPVEVAPQQVIEAPPLRQEIPQEPSIDWEHKFKTIEGMLKARNGEVERQLATKDAEIEAERNARINAEQELAEVPLNYAEIMGDEAYDDLGEGAVDGIGKMIQAQVAKQLAVKETENMLKNNLQQSTKP